MTDEQYPGDQQPDPQPGGQQPGGQQPQPSNQMYPEQSQATLALVLGILGLVICGILGPFAWWIGDKEVKGIDAGRRPPENRGTANAGRILGIIATVLLALGILFLIGVVGLGFMGAVLEA